MSGIRNLAAGITRPSFTSKSRWMPSPGQITVLTVSFPSGEAALVEIAFENVDEWRTNEMRRSNVHEWQGWAE
ncbi:hypothetical protein N7536_010394 [Penicillium majusculum]|nr:hypothetical protein N7536_010394 [Penicillium majusculum]